MIDPATLTESDKGRSVVYEQDYCDRQYGSLSSWNDLYVFVRFKGPNGEACRPCDVRFADVEFESAQPPIPKSRRPKPPQGSGGTP